MVFPRCSAGQRGQKPRQWAGKDGKAKALIAIAFMAWIPQQHDDCLSRKVKNDPTMAPMC